MTITFYFLAFTGLIISYSKNKQTTVIALKKAWRSFENILPQLLPIFLMVGIMLSIITPEQISQYLGSESGWLGVILAACIGAITLIPPFVAFPLAAVLLGNGADYMQIAAFISTLTMVGVLTFPLEMKYFGKKATLLRNGLAFIFAFVVAMIMGVFM